MTTIKITFETKIFNFRSEQPATLYFPELLFADDHAFLPRQDGQVE